MTTRAWTITACVAVALLIGVLVAVAYLVSEQRKSNQLILSTVAALEKNLSADALRSRALADEVARLKDTVGGLERNNDALRQKLAAVRATTTAPVTEITLPLDSIAMTAYAELSAPVVSAELTTALPITWSADATALPPGQGIARLPEFPVQRMIGDPGFIKRMFIGYGVLQAADIATTLTAINGGAREANPVLAPVVSEPWALIGAKTAGTIATVWTVGKLQKRNPVVAGATLIAINAALTAVVVNNVSASARQHRSTEKD